MKYFGKPLQIFSVLAVLLIGLLSVGTPNTSAAPSVAKLTSCHVKWNGKNYRGTDPSKFVKKYKADKCDVDDGANCKVIVPEARNGVWRISCKVTAAMAKNRCAQGGGTRKFCESIDPAWISTCSGDFGLGSKKFVECLKNAKKAQEDPTNVSVPIVTDPALDFTGASCLSADDCTLIKKYVNPIIAVLGALVGIAVVIGLIVGGIQYSSSGGDPQKVASAKGHIQKALVALVAFVFLYALLQWLIPGGVI